MYNNNNMPMLSLSLSSFHQPSVWSSHMIMVIKLVERSPVQFSLVATFYSLKKKMLVVKYVFGRKALYEKNSKLLF